MPAATKHSEGWGSQSSVQVHVCDPTLVAAYFFNGVETCAPTAEGRLSAVFDTLAVDQPLHRNSKLVGELKHPVLRVCCSR